MVVFPSWLDTLCTVSLMLGLVCALAVLFYILRHPSHMAIMRIVWPVCALFGTVFVLWLYFRSGREVGHPSGLSKKSGADSKMPGMSQPYPLIVVEGTLHCGSDCMLGDLIAEWLAFAALAFAIRRKNLRGMGVRPHSRFGFRHRLSVFRDRAHAKTLPRPGDYGGAQGRHLVFSRLADRHVLFDGCIAIPSV